MKKLTWKEAIITVLSESKAPMHYTEITDRILSRKLFTTSGATPTATVNAQITTSINSNPAASPFIALGQGFYFLRSKVGSPAPKAKKRQSSGKTAEIDYGVVRAFGMFWRRELVDWKQRPRIFGRQGLTAKSVDVSAQQGVYLLYDGREVIYVGRASARGIGERLFEHHVGRLAARWDRFSWFGLLPISPDGSLGVMPKQVSSDFLIHSFESVLIESLEPRQNRKRGDEFEALEFVQAVDEDFEKKKAKKIAISALVGD